MLQRSVNASAGSEAYEVGRKSASNTGSRMFSALASQPCPSRWDTEGANFPGCPFFGISTRRTGLRPVGADRSSRAHRRRMHRPPLIKTFLIVSPSTPARAIPDFGYSRDSDPPKLRSSVTRPHSLQNT